MKKNTFFGFWQLTQAKKQSHPHLEGIPRQIKPTSPISFAPQYLERGFKNNNRKKTLKEPKKEGEKRKKERKKEKIKYIPSKKEIKYTLGKER